MESRFIEKLCRFGPLAGRDVTALARATENGKTVAKRHDLIREGDRPGVVFVMLDGWACRYKILPGGARQVLGFLMPGDSCDLHIGLLAKMDHSIQTITKARVATISRVEMDTLLEGHQAIAKAMYISQLIDEGTMRAWITSIGRRVSIERVAHLLCELFLRAKNVGLIKQPPFEIPLSQAMLADSLGMTAIHINRVLKQLRLDEAIALSRGSVTVLDPSKLAQTAGFDESYLHRRLRSTN